MAEYTFGVSRRYDRPTPAREAQRRDRICRREGGYGWTEIDSGHRGTGPWLGWYSGPNRGEPFDRQLAARVLTAVGAISA